MARILTPCLAALGLLVSAAGCFEADEHVTTTVNSSVLLNCPINFPDGNPVDHIIKWEIYRKGMKPAIVYIWYDGYAPHEGEGYKGRVSRIRLKDANGAPLPSQYGQASLNLTNVRISDQGLYHCKIYFLDRSPDGPTNGSFIYMEVQSAPRIVEAPREANYVNMGESLILQCVAQGTPPPRIEWNKDKEVIPVDSSNRRVRIMNDGMELRISNIKMEDIGDYECVARNGVPPETTAIARIMVAGGARITRRPQNLTLNEGGVAEMECGALGQPRNITILWKKDGELVEAKESLSSRSIVNPATGTLKIHPLTADDSGWYTCEVTNGIGGFDTASAYLNVEYPAHVYFTPTPQYLPFQMSGIVNCPIDANPPFQFVTWTKDARLFEPKQHPDVVELWNGSLLFQSVGVDDQGGYRCAPYNAHGTKGRSDLIEVLVREPPTFTKYPKESYRRKLDGNVRFPCKGAGTPTPTIAWKRRDGKPVPKNRVKFDDGDLIISKISKDDHGYYECEVSNEVASVVRSTLLVVLNTPPHAPENVTVETSEFSATLRWQPGYSGGDEESLKYIIWYKKNDTKRFSSAEVKPPRALNYTIYRLEPATWYNFQVLASNKFGNGRTSRAVTARTKDQLHPVQPSNVPLSPTEGAGGDFTLLQEIPFASPAPGAEAPVDSGGEAGSPEPPEPSKEEEELSGPKPGKPRNVTVSEEGSSVVIDWLPPEDLSVPVAYYTIEYKTEDRPSLPWRKLTQDPIGDRTKYRAENIKAGRSYSFRVIAHTFTNREPSDTVKYKTSHELEKRAVTAGIVSGVLFFIVAIILSICAVKICNKRRRRKHEQKAYNMVACRLSETRNGGGSLHSPVPFKKIGEGGVPIVMNGIRRFRFRFGLLVSEISHVMVKLRRRRFKHGRPSHRQEFPYHPSHYSVRAQQTPALSTPQQSVRWIARSRDGKFIVDGLATGGSSSSSDEGGFLAAPPRPPPPNWKSYEPVQTGVYHVGGSRSHPWNPFADVSETSDRSEPSLFVTPIHTIFTPDGRRFRASSPGPSKQLRSLRNLNELSSVHYPSSVERSFPSTIRSRPTPQSTSMRRIQEEYEFPAAFSPQLYTTWTPLSTKSFQHQVQVEVHHDPHHLPGIPYHTAPPTAAPPPIFYPYPPYPYVLPYPYPPYYHPAYSIEVHSPPTSPRGTGHLVPPRIPDISPPKPVPIYENIRVTQRPLATSSPPRRRRGKPPLPLSPPEFRPLPKPPVQALADTREKIQDAIGRLKHQRHNSAPELGVSPGSRAGDSGLDSSSGFGSKNTSSQPTQSSSGFEASPPSLDTSLSRRLHSSPQLLDASVDDPYEFDSIHTGDDTTAPQSVSPRHFQARRSLGGGNASDSEMYTRSSDKVGGTFLEEEPPEPADLEARVRAMKAEFQQYRQKQAARKRTGTILESAC